MTLGILPFHSGIQLNVCYVQNIQLIFYADLKLLSPVAL